MTRPLIAVVAALLLVAATNDPLAEQQWHLDQVHAYDAWSVTTGEDVVVAVLDTGVDASHPDLRERMVRGVDLVDRNTPPDDPNGHGTLVAGIIAATAGNERGGAGVAPRARIMPVRVLDEEGAGSGSTVAEGVRWAARNGAQVINLSLADAEVPGFTDSVARTVVARDIERAITEAHEAGAVVVAAAGNDGRDETPYREDTPLIVVGASDRDDQRWPDSNADRRTLFAPGVEIISTWREHGYAKADGTSFSAPVVAGGVALLLARGLEHDRVERRLAETAQEIGDGLRRVDLAAAVGASVERPASPRPRPRPSPSPDSEAGTRGSGASAPEPVPLDVVEPPEPTPTPEAEAPPAEPTAEPTPTVAPTAEPDETTPEEVAVAAPPPQPPASTLSLEDADGAWVVPFAVALLVADVVGLTLLAVRRMAPTRA